MLPSSQAGTSPVLEPGPRPLTCPPLQLCQKLPARSTQIESLPSTFLGNPQSPEMRMLSTLSHYTRKEERLTTGLSDPKLTKQDKDTQDICLQCFLQEHKNTPLALPKILLLLNNASLINNPDSLSSPRPPLEIITSSSLLLAGLPHPLPLPAPPSSRVI